MPVCVCVLVLQALVEVDGSGVGTDLSYPLLQICLQPAHTHRTAKRWLNVSELLLQEM